MVTRDCFIPARQRIMLGVVGLASWMGGGLATFVSDNGAGSVALVTAGAATGGLSLMGRWPSRITLSGNEFAWQEAIEEQIVYAEESGEPAATVEELRILLNRLRQLEETGTAPPHPAAKYDEEVERALQRTKPPGAVIRKAQQRSRDVPDFELELDDARLFVETKYRAGPGGVYRGGTLPRLVENVQPDGRLLVVVNTSRYVEALQYLQREMPGRAEIVRWNHRRDDEGLRRGIRALLSASSPAKSEGARSDSARGATPA